MSNSDTYQVTNSNIKKYKDLDWWEQRNKDMNKDAKAFLRFCSLSETTRVYTSPILYEEK